MTTETDLRLVYSIDEVAVLLGVSRNHAFKQVRDGAIPSVKLGRRLLVPKQALAALLARSAAA
jgi:excisionase family DNA binding protein